MTYRYFISYEGTNISTTGMDNIILKVNKQISTASDIRKAENIIAEIEKEIYKKPFLITIVNYSLLRKSKY